MLRPLESVYSADIVQRGRILDSEYLGLPLKFTDIQSNHLQNGCKNSWLENIIANAIDYMKALCKPQNATQLILNIMTYSSLKNACKHGLSNTHKPLKVPFKVLLDSFSWHRIHQVWPFTLFCFNTEHSKSSTLDSSQRSFLRHPHNILKPLPYWLQAIVALHADPHWKHKQKHHITSILTTGKFRRQVSTWNQGSIGPAHTDCHIL